MSRRVLIWNMFIQNMRKRNREGSAGSGLFALVFFAILSVWVLSGCTSKEGGRLIDESIQKSDVFEAGTREDEKLHVVTTIFPQYDFVRELGQDHVSLQMLLKPGEETHSYEPTPQDILAVQKADLFIYVGGENDAWVEDILESPEMKQIRTLRLVDCVDTLEEEHVEGMKEERSLGHGAEEAEEDEHVWTSPQNVIQIITKITEELISLDNSHQMEYQTNLKTYTEQLSQLDMQFRETAEKAAQQGSNILLFGDRFPFRYFAQEYGLEYYAAFPGCASDTEPSAATMAFLIRKVKEEKLPVVLKMELSSDQIANAVAEAAGVQVRGFYSCHNLTAEQFENGSGYLSMMQENVETLKAALGIDIS